MEEKDKNDQVIIFKALNVLSMLKFDFFFFFCLFNKVDFYLAYVNLRLLKWFANYPVNFISRNIYT